MRFHSSSSLRSADMILSTVTGISLEKSMVDTSEDTSLQVGVPGGPSMPEGPSLSDTSPTSPLIQPKTANRTSNELPLRQQQNLVSTNNAPPIPPPTRRPPPAPLNLSPTGAHEPISGLSALVGMTRQEEALQAESETDDAADDGGPERGRRKTREEDDREREIVAAKEHDSRSRSTKHKSKPVAIQPPNPKLSHAQGTLVLPTMGLPASPRVGSHATNTLSVVMNARASALNLPMSPGLPMSPRPTDRPPGSPLPRGQKDVFALAPMTPGASGMPLSPRAPKYPIRLPPGFQPEGEVTSVTIAPTAASAPAVSSKVPLPAVTQTPAPVAQPEERTKPEKSGLDQEMRADNIPTDIGPTSRHFTGLMSSDYPDLLLPPGALSSVQIKVMSSRLRPSRSSLVGPKQAEEPSVFTLGVFSRSNKSELWRVEKSIIALAQLDQNLRQLNSNFSARVPDRSMFTGHSPAKVDARRAAINNYFEVILDSSMEESSALVVCRFLTSDALEPDETNTTGDSSCLTMLNASGKRRMEGYLTKRGKNFGGWKARYFVLDSPHLRYYEAPGGAHMGTIKVQHAQIGRQPLFYNNNQSPSRQGDDSESQYRHAFIILEPKKKDSSALVRHVLCAESDEERDAWVEALISYVEPDSDDEPVAVDSQLYSSATSAGKCQATSKNKDTNSSEPGDNELRAFRYDDVTAGEAPIRGPIKPSMLLRVENDHQYPTSPSLKSISGPTNGAVIQDASSWGNRTPTTPTTPAKKRSLWGFRGAASSTSDLNTQVPSNDNHETKPMAEYREIKPVFGLPLVEAVEFCGPRGIDCGLPAVVYRCIEYLRAKNAAMEEGIFRLSGSNVVIKALKEKFNAEGDFDFLAHDHYYDLHAIASLFKQYLRELPTSVLTSELEPSFLQVLGKGILHFPVINLDMHLIGAGVNDKQKRIKAFNILVHRLPKPNIALLEALSLFLIVVVNNADVNKMTVRNVCIVFAPTLNIPAPVFSLFLTDFDAIFGDLIGPGDGGRTTEPSVLASSSTPDDIHSPRPQVFTNLSTPDINQLTFPASPGIPRSATFPDPRTAYDTGFAGFRRASEHLAPSVSVDDSFALPANDALSGDSSSQTLKAKRRESSLLFMTMGNKNNDFRGKNERC